MTVTGQTPWRQLGDLAMDQFTALIPDGSPMLPESRAIYAAVKGYSALYAAQESIARRPPFLIVKRHVVALSHHAEMLRVHAGLVMAGVVKHCVFGQCAVPLFIDIAMSKHPSRFSHHLAVAMRVLLPLPHPAPRSLINDVVDPTHEPRVMAGKKTHRLAFDSSPLSVGQRGKRRSLPAAALTIAKGDGIFRVHRLVLSTGAALRGCIRTRRSISFPHIISQIPYEYAHFMKGVAV